MKNLVYNSILFILALLLSACNITKKEKFVIGVSQCSDDMWRHTMNNEMLREASIYQNIDVVIRTVKDDTSKQIQDIEDLINDSVDLLVISPNESTAITPIIQKAYKAGIPVILVDRKIDTEDYTAYVGADNYQIGKEAAIYVAGILNGKGNVVEIRGWNGSTSDLERHNGFTEQLKNYPDIQIVAEERGNFIKEEAEKKMSEILKEKSNIALVFALNDPMALGVYSAASKYSGKLPFIIGIDALPGEGGGIQSIEKGYMDASFIYPTGGDKVIDLAMKILSGKPFARENTLYTAVVDKQNARVIQLQTDQIAEHQAKLEKVNETLNQNMIQYSNQQILFYGTILTLILISILLLVAFSAYKSKSKANSLLRKRNKEIKYQADVLQEQKEQLISLSEQLEEATNAKLVFFTNVSHEFRTPLTLILGPVERLLESGSLSEEQVRLLDLVQRNSKKLFNLISEVLEFRSYENGKMQMFFSKDDLRLFIEDLNVVFSDYANRRQIIFNFDSSDANYNTWFDKEKVEKIYFNLLSNAFKHTEPDKQINVKLRVEVLEDKQYVKLVVFNDGLPIPEDKINNIFNRFYKVNSHDSGTGIGLALTSALVDMHDGSIKVESQEGLGTTFTVLLPFIQQTPSNAEEFASDSYEPTYSRNLIELETNLPESDGLLRKQSDANKPLIILIEDNKDMRSYMKYILSEEYDIIEAENGEKGINKAIKYVPDVVICDVMMPEKDGFEVCQTLKENLASSHIPIILLTACSLDEQKAIGFEKGADAYIAKPFNSELLKIRIRKLIENRSRIKEAYSKSLINGSSKIKLNKIEQNFMESFRIYVESQIMEPEISVNNIASHLGVSRTQLYRKLKSVTDYSPNELVNVIKLKYATNLLLAEHKTISEVAFETGFSSPSYFTKIFKKYYNESPTEFIKIKNRNK